MIPFPALGGALMDAHDRCEAADRRPRVLAEVFKAVGDTIRVEHEIADHIGWSFERVHARGCQLWGELRDDDRWAGVAS